MSGSTAEIHWFPKYPERFITWGSEINLYEVKNIEDVDTRIATNINLNISSTTATASLLASETRYQYIRCVAPSYRSAEPLLAVGLANGKVGLCNFVPSTENNIEFTPKQSRPCVCLAWHETDTNLLAIGHDRNRSDHCITVWDTERGVPKDKSILNSIGLSETAHSLCWDRNNQILVAGMSHKYIKLMDLRQSNILLIATNTRAVHGLSMAPNGRFLASYIDNLVTLWDIRSIERPVSVHQMEKNVNALSWCTTRLSTLATLQRDSPFIHLLDLHSPSVEIEFEPHSIKRLVAPFQNKITANSRNITLSNMSWHPVDVERLLALSGSGAICDFKIQQRVAIAFDPLNNLCGSIDVDLKCLNNSAFTPPSTPSDFVSWDNEQHTHQPQEDIAELIHRRAINDYGKIPDLQKNGDLSQNPKLKSIWKLMAHMIREDCLLGLKSILGITSNPNEMITMSRSDTNHLHWLDYPSGPTVKVFESDSRDFGQMLCGWTYDKSNKESFIHFIDGLCADGEYTRASLIAVFHLKIRYAIEILGIGAERVHNASNLRMAAIALSGFTFEKSLWRSQCAVAHSQLSDPHLRALFSFLTPDDTYDSILNEPGVSVGDRMAFACNYLCDTKLAEYVKKMIQCCTETGDLNGLLMTGATPEGINLLQNYIDCTEDVQTVALIAIKFLSKDLLADNVVDHWISSYRELLDKWGMWDQRAHFDIMMGQIRSPPKYSRSVFLLCSFCGKSVSACLQEEARLRSTSSNVNKLSSCPNCRKPLPRCSLCLLHMGTTTGLSLQSPQNNSTANDNYNGWQSKPFSRWFSWCQSCRHGGHTEHLSQWFSQHLECPVASCTCKCFSMDLSIPQFSKEISF